MRCPWGPALALGIALTSTLYSGCEEKRRSDYFSPAPLVRPPVADITVEPPPLELPLDTLPTFVGLFQQLSPSVVNVYTQEDLGSLTSESAAYGTSLGSGMILDSAGLILTSGHVVENASEIRVRLHDAEELPARLIGLDPIRDLALIKVDGARALKPIEPGDSRALQVGDWVAALGNPMGLEHTMTKGIISGLGRSEFVDEQTGYLDLIQFDAPVYHGSSGGPLVDIKGRVIGVTAALSAEGQRIGFAIGWHVVEDALPRLLQGGQVSRSWLGVYVREDLIGGVTRLVVSAVVQNSPADHAGIRVGDYVLALDEHRVRGASEFRLRVAATVAGREMVLDLERDGLPLRAFARLEEAPNIR